MIPARGLTIQDHQAKSNPTRLLVVIPCLNEEDSLEHVVLSCQPANQFMPTQIVIADGGSTDGTLQIARKLSALFPNVRLINNPQRIQSAAVNIAVNQFGASADLLIRLDAHAKYPIDYCRILVEESENTGAASVVVRMQTLGVAWFQRAVAAAQNSALGNGGSKHRTLHHAGCWTDHGHHALIRLDAFRAIGGYDESFSHNEDAEFDYRLNRAGMKIWLTAKTSLHHYPRATPRALFRQYVAYGAGRARTMIKHRVRPRIRQAAPIVILPITLIGLASRLSWTAGLPFMIWVVGCLAYGIVLAFREKSVAALASGPAAMIMHFAWSVGFWEMAARLAFRRPPFRR